MDKTWFNKNFQQGVAAAITFWNDPEIVIDDKITYFVSGKETCPETNREHWHVYVEFKKMKRSTLLNRLGGDKKVKCLQVQMKDAYIAYCKKDGNFTEGGTMSGGQGARTDLKGIVDALKAGTKLQDIMLENPEVYCRYRNGLKDIAAVVIQKSLPDWRDIDVVLMTGPTGCGKTREAWNFSLNRYKIMGTMLNWWQDYEGQDTLIIDEYNNDVKITALLPLLDGYECRLAVKGGHTYANWTKIFITTNLTVEELHRDAKPEHKKALMRRITQIRSFWPLKSGDEVVQG